MWDKDKEVSSSYIMFIFHKIVKVYMVYVLIVAWVVGKGDIYI